MKGINWFAFGVAFCLGAFAMLAALILLGVF
jgi:hypothetical protein